MRTQLLDFLSKNRLGKDVSAAEVPAQISRAKGGSRSVPKSHLTPEPGWPLDRPGEMPFYFEEAGTPKEPEEAENSEHFSALWMQTPKRLPREFLMARAPMSGWWRRTGAGDRTPPSHTFLSFLRMVQFPSIRDNPQLLGISSGNSRDSLICMWDPKPRNHQSKKN